MFFVWCSLMKKWRSWIEWMIFIEARDLWLRLMVYGFAWDEKNNISNEWENVMYFVWCSLMKKWRSWIEWMIFIEARDLWLRLMVYGFAWDEKNNISNEWENVMYFVWCSLMKKWRSWIERMIFVEAVDLWWRKFGWFWTDVNEMVRIGGNTSNDPQLEDYWKKDCEVLRQNSHSSMQ